MGSANSKSRKPKQQHLPKVGTAQSRAHEEEARAKATWDLSKWWLLAIVVGVILTMVVIVILAS